MGWRFIIGYMVFLKIFLDEVEVNWKKLVKFKEFFWKCVYFLIVEILVLVVIYDELWFIEIKYYWIGFGD